MLHLRPEAERLARLVAKRSGCTPEEVVVSALEREARASGLPDLQARRMTAAEMLTMGEEIASLPLRDPRSPRDIMDELSLA